MAGPQSTAENETIRAMDEVKKWIGGTDQETDLTWLWEDGTELGNGKTVGFVLLCTQYRQDVFLYR